MCFLQNFVFFVVEREQKRQTKDNWNFWFWFFCTKMAVSWRTSVFQTKPCWNPYFYSVFWVRAFWAKVSKKEILDTHQKRKNWLITKKLFFGVFGVFSVFFFCFLLFLFSFVFGGFLFFFGGFKGQSRWPEGPPHFPKPSLFCFFGFFVFDFFWRVQGSCEVALRATSLGPNSLSLFFLILSYVFCSTWLFLISKQTT